MRRMLFAAMVAASLSGFAQEAANAPAAGDVAARPAAPDKVRAIRHPLRAGAGGFLHRRGPGLPLVFLDMRGAEATDLSFVIQDMQGYSRLAIDVEKADGADGIAAALAMKKDGKAAAVVAIAKAGDAPALVVCPEDNVAAINIDRLAKDLPAEDGAAALAKRLGKEIWRAVGLALAGYTSHDPCVMKPVADVKDLDGLEMRMYCPQVNDNVGRAAAKAGVARLQLVPYGMAVRQGWAPAPTNDAQRAIWRLVKEGEAAAATNAPAAK